jgi:peptide/nickel transport system ATP-binding protein
MNSELLRVNNLQTFFFTYEGVVHAVDNISFSLMKGESLGLAGESGCGKSTAAYSILKLVAEPGRIVGGNILFEGEDLLKKNEYEMQKIRGRRISIIFQEPKSAMNPSIKLGDQIAEAIQVHKKISRKEALEEALKWLELVGVASPKKVAESYPFQQGPGEVQQAMIAMALSCNASLLIADEPTTAMDASTEAHIISLLKDLRHKLNLSMIYITHNLGNIAQLCDSVAIMYAGKIVEIGEMRKIFKDPIHPYTYGLLQAHPRFDVDLERLPEIPGTVINLINPPKGCRFYPRCAKGKDKCKDKEPKLVEVKSNHFVACWEYLEE